MVQHARRRLAATAIVREAVGAMLLGSARLADDLVVFRVRTDPKPGDAVLHVNAKSTIVQTDAHGGILADSF